VRTSSRWLRNRIVPLPWLRPERPKCISTLMSRPCYNALPGTLVLFGVRSMRARSDGAGRLHAPFAAPSIFHTLATWFKPPSLPVWFGGGRVRQVHIHIAFHRSTLERLCFQGLRTCPVGRSSRPNFSIGVYGPESGWLGPSGVTERILRYRIEAPSPVPSLASDTLHTI